MLQTLRGKALKEPEVMTPHSDPKPSLLVRTPHSWSEHHGSYGAESEPERLAAWMQALAGEGRAGTWVGSPSFLNPKRQKRLFYRKIIHSSEMLFKKKTEHTEEKILQETHTAWRSWYFRVESLESVGMPFPLKSEPKRGGAMSWLHTEDLQQVFQR